SDGFHVAEACDLPLCCSVNESVPKGHDHKRWVGSRIACHGKNDFWERTTIYSGIDDSVSL
ncbi:hypothetical protein A2U01_0113026, partial [Trifolium medium]|nr:hypothetical protein [Trifolium medium]